MQRNRLLYSPHHVEAYRIALREAKDDLREMHERHTAEMESLRGELRELREILTILVAVGRSQVEGELAGLRRQLETQLARLARLERDPQKPLH
jgi:hypothetical protein